MKISVVMAAYNGENYVGEAIESILAQTEKSLELIVVNDGSTDGTKSVLEKFSDPRVRIVNLPVNCGIATARNVGMACVEGDYLAVMDADDVALPARLETQLQFMEKNPAVHILGSRTIRTNEDVNSEIDRPMHPLSDGEIKANLLLLNGTAMIHPTMMARMSFIREHNLLYPPPPRGRVGIDHEFWIKCVAKGAVFQNIPDVLLLKRRHSSNVTLLNAQAGISRNKSVSRAELLGLYYPDLSANEAKALAAILEPTSQLSVMEASLGLAAGHKAMLYGASHYGESKEHLRRIVGQAITRWLEALAPRSG